MMLLPTLLHLEYSLLASIQVCLNHLLRDMHFLNTRSNHCLKTQKDLVLLFQLFSHHQLVLVTVDVVSLTLSLALQ